MSLIERARKDVIGITTNSNEWAVEVYLSAPTGETLVMNGVHKKVHMGIDTDGSQINAKDATVTLAEKVMVDAVYPVRNSSQEVSLYNHRIDIADSTGVVKNYVIRQWYPDETLGLIVCILGDFE